MQDQNIPEIFTDKRNILPDLLLHDFKMTADVVKTKVNLGMHMFSFLQSGSKQVHFSNNSIAVNPDQSLLVKKGNCLMTELLKNDKIYFCKLLFFSQNSLQIFLDKHQDIFSKKKSKQEETSYFIIKNDKYINSFVDSLSSIQQIKTKYSQDLLTVKFEELMLYLLNIYGNSFIVFIQSLVVKDSTSSFKNIVETNAISTLKLEEIAFLCNMSLSTFKRHFIEAYNLSPGKWFQQKRLNKAKEILQEGILKPSQIYFDLGYNNLSNFSIAFKNEFGISPKKVIQTVF